MSALSANCPSCGAAIAFKSGASIVLVCDYCRSVVARTDRALEDLGRVAEIVETGSPLQVGLRGAWRGIPFELTGRAQLGHEAGGIWDEWYATFANGWLGWLAEAQGRFYLTFGQNITQSSAIPPFEHLHLGQTVPAIPTTASPLVVAEKGEARALGASGEIPYRLTPGQTYYYADLSGGGGAFATIDYSETPPLVFTGHEVTLADLGISASIGAREASARRVSAATLNCPKCGGGLTLQAPDRTERVTCPNCDSLLDVSQGKLSFFKALKTGKVEPLIPIGSTGEFEGGQLTVIGFMQRSVEIEGTRYFWTEYLLYNPQTGFRWLVQSDNHWSFVQPVPPGEALVYGQRARFRGQSFKIFQDARARVEYVRGEFYWKVEAGEQAWATDYVKAPLMLSKEVSRTVEQKGKNQIEKGEINWSLGTYVPVREVEKTFNLKGLPRPSMVAPNQPFPHKGIYKYWGILLLALILVAFIATVTGGSNGVMNRSFEFQPLANAEGTQVVFSDQLELQGRRNIKVYALSPVDNSWIYVAGDLVNDETGLVQTFELPIEYYHGVEDGESWSEGSTSRTTYLSALPAGKYTLRLEAQWERWQQPATVTVQIEQGAVSGFNAVAAIVVLSIIPIIILLWHWMFERRRWSESMFGGGSSE